MVSIMNKGISNMCLKNTENCCNSVLDINIIPIPKKIYPMSNSGSFIKCYNKAVFIIMHITKLLSCS